MSGSIKAALCICLFFGTTLGAFSAPWNASNPKSAERIARLQRVSAYIDATLNVTLMRGIYSTAKRIAKERAPKVEAVHDLDDVRLLISVISDEIRILKQDLLTTSYSSRPALLTQLQEAEGTLEDLERAESQTLSDPSRSAVEIAERDLDLAVEEALTALEATTGHPVNQSFVWRLHAILNLDAPDPALLDALPTDQPSVAAMVVLPQPN